MNEPFAEVPRDFDQHMNHDGHNSNRQAACSGGGFPVGKVLVNASDDGVGRQLKWCGRQIGRDHQNSFGNWDSYRTALRFNR
jgi:hypothetical protein